MIIQYELLLINYIFNNCCLSDAIENLKLYAYQAKTKGIRIKNQ